MAKQDIETTEYTWDDGTYQTGATQPGKGQSGLIAGLLAATIFLGGIASALGIMNIRLLQQLNRPTEPVLPVAVDGTGAAGEFLRENPDLIPTVPKDGRLELQTDSTFSITGLQPQDPAAAATAQLTVTDSRGDTKTARALVLSGDGYLLTNAHITDSALNLTVELSDGRILPAALVACDPYSDLAVVYVQAQDLVPASFAVGLLQSPPAEGQNETTGPVFDQNGRVMAFRCRNFQTHEMMEIAAEEMMTVATQLVENRCVSGRPFLGLQVQAVSDFARRYWNLEYGAQIIWTEQPQLMEGDILLAVNGQPLQTCHQLHQMLLTITPAAAVELTIFRTGQTFTVHLPVEIHP